MLFFELGQMERDAGLSQDSPCNLLASRPRKRDCAELSSTSP